MTISFYLPTTDGRPVQKLFDRGWFVSYGFDFLGVHFIKYSNRRY
jgi:hypothetical protein